MIYKGKPYVISPYDFRRPRVEANEVGKDVLSFIKTSAPDSTFDAMLAKMTSMYDVDPEVLKEDICAFLEDCIQKDILLNRDQEVECEEVLREIHSIQESIPELEVSNFGLVARLGQKQFTPGCQSCARGKWAVFFVGVRCNLDCWYCPYTGGVERERVDHTEEADGVESIGFLGVHFRSFRDLKFQFSLMHEKFDAFAWLGGEPMMPKVLDDILPLIRYFHETYPRYHQWMYTNGTFATRESMLRLREVGIRELRFNLGATNFNRKVIARMKEARQIFDYVCLETPMTKKHYEGLMANIDAVLDTGLDQMNLAEFIVGEHVFKEGSKALDEEGRLYNYKGFICSPVQSRHYTYDVIRRAAKEKWPVVINDCSNEYKYYKLSIQENKGTNIFQGRHGYWNNTYRLEDIDTFNDSLLARSRGKS